MRIALPRLFLFLILFVACSHINKKVVSIPIGDVMKIEVYAVSWCPPCKREIDYLSSRNMKHTVYWLDSKDVNYRKYRARMKQLCEKADRVPTTIITDKSGKEYCVTGFSKDDFKQLFSLQ